MSAEKKLGCGCYTEWRQGNEGGSWAISAVAFLCDKGHHQGDVTSRVPAERSERSET